MPLHGSKRPMGGDFVALLMRKPLVTIGAAFLLVVLIIWYEHSPGPSAEQLPTIDVSFESTKDFNGQWNYERDRNNLMFDNKQCLQAFPNLFTEVDRAVNERRNRNITVEELNKIEPKNGYVRAMIYDQQVRKHSHTFPNLR